MNSSYFMSKIICGLLDFEQYSLQSSHLIRWITSLKLSQFFWDNLERYILGKVNGSSEILTLSIVVLSSCYQGDDYEPVVVQLLSHVQLFAVP